jgi:hypothetical protein
VRDHFVSQKSVQSWWEHGMERKRKGGEREERERGREEERKRVRE